MPYSPVMGRSNGRWISQVTIAACGERDPGGYSYIELACGQRGNANQAPLHRLQLGSRGMQKGVCPSVHTSALL